MAEQESPQVEQLYKTYDMELAAFLLARGCEMKDSKLGDGNRAEFCLSGPNTFDIIKDWDSRNSVFAKFAHTLFSDLKQVRDVANRRRKEAVEKAGGKR